MSGWRWGRIWQCLQQRKGGTGRAGWPQTRKVGSAKHLRDRSRLIDQRSHTPGFRVVRSAGAMAHSPTNSAWTTRGTRGRHPGPGRARDDRLGTGSCPGRGGEAALRVWSAGARRTCLHRCGSAHAAAALAVPTSPRPANRRGSRSPAGDVPGRPGGRPPGGDVQGGRRRAVVAILGRPRGRPPVVPRSRARVMRTRLRSSVAPEGDRQSVGVGLTVAVAGLAILGHPKGRDRQCTAASSTRFHVHKLRSSIATEGDRHDPAVLSDAVGEAVAILGRPRRATARCTRERSTTRGCGCCDPRSPQRATARVPTLAVLRQDFPLRSLVIPGGDGHVYATSSF